MSTEPDRIAALARFGYTDRQSAFLALAALHGGYFLRRHYTVFTGHGHGLAVVRFLETVVRRQHARPLRYGRHGQLYHLHARPLYAALGQEHNRNRRDAEWRAVTRKLMALDFVLAHRGVRFWATEEDKVAHSRESGVDALLWPHRTYRARRAGAPATIRYFVDKMPWYRAADDDRLWIAYLNAESTLQGFRMFVQEYKPLLSSMPAGVTYVSYAWAGATVQDVFRRVMGARVAAGAGSETFQKFCRLRREIEANRLQGLTVKEIQTYRELRPVFASAQYDAAYERWFRGGEDTGAGPSAATPEAPTCALRVFQLPHRYAPDVSRAGSDPPQL